MIITLRAPILQKDVDLELPDEVPMRDLVPALVQALELPTTSQKGNPARYQLLRRKRRRPLREGETLAGAGVSTGDFLSLVSVGTQPQATQHTRAGDRWGSSALLRSPSGMVFALDNYGKSELTLGRYDARTGNAPDIDLSEEPDGKTVSRQHALLRKQGGRWVLVPLSTKNPTCVGKKRLSSKQSRALEPGDTIVLGGVELVFESGP